jgi:transcriptional regulator with XRE-family HTH domain
MKMFNSVRYPALLPKPEWATRILELRHKLGLNQTVFGIRLLTSTMAVSRWERGVQEPPSHSYIEIGNLAGDPLNWYFWGRAGLQIENVMKALPAMRKRLRKAQIPDFEVKCSRSGKSKKAGKLGLTGIPFLQAVVACHGEKGDDNRSFHDSPIRSMIAFPQEWCPNPSSTCCLRVHGNSMAPTICDGYIVAADSSQANHNQLDGHIVIAWEKDNGLIVSRFRKYNHTETLQPEDPKYRSITLGRKGNKWKVLATVIWWIGNVP